MMPSLSPSFEVQHSNVVCSCPEAHWAKGSNRVQSGARGHQQEGGWVPVLSNCEKYGHHGTRLGRSMAGMGKVFGCHLLLAPNYCLRPTQKRGCASTTFCRAMMWTGLGSWSGNKPCRNIQSFESRSLKNPKCIGTCEWGDTGRKVMGILKSESPDNNKCVPVFKVCDLTLLNDARRSCLCSDICHQIPLLVCQGRICPHKWKSPSLWPPGGCAATNTRWCREYL